MSLDYDTLLVLQKNETLRQLQDWETWMTSEEINKTYWDQ